MPPSVLVAAPVKVVRLTSGPVRVVRVVAPQPVRVLSVGQQGRPGAAGAAPVIPAIAAVLGIRGRPVYLSKANGQLYPASAAGYQTAFVLGLLDADVQAGFPANAQRGPFTLPDWTALTGTPSLLVGQLYFLATDGSLTAILPARPQAVALTRVGQAVSSTTLDVQPSPPFML